MREAEVPKGRVRVLSRSRTFCQVGIEPRERVVTLPQEQEVDEREEQYEQRLLFIHPIEQLDDLSIVSHAGGAGVIERRASQRWQDRAQPSPRILQTMKAHHHRLDPCLRILSTISLHHALLSGSWKADGVRHTPRSSCKNRSRAVSLRGSSRGRCSRSARCTAWRKSG